MAKRINDIYKNTNIQDMFRTINHNLIQSSDSCIIKAVGLNNKLHCNQYNSDCEKCLNAYWLSDGNIYKKL